MRMDFSSFVLNGPSTSMYMWYNAYHNLFNEPPSKYLLLGWFYNDFFIIGITTIAKINANVEVTDSTQWYV